MHLRAVVSSVCKFFSNFSSLRLENDNDFARFLNRKGWNKECCSIRKVNFLITVVTQLENGYFAKDFFLNSVICMLFQNILENYKILQGTYRVFNLNWNKIISYYFIIVITILTE